MNSNRWIRIVPEWLLLLAGFVLGLCGGAQGAASPLFQTWAPTPPMGWNSWDCFATTVTEAQTRAQADHMAEQLARYGWQYIVVDIQWYEPHARGFDYRKGAPLVMDEFGRLWPATNRFPSAADHVGFKALSDYVHSRGLKFGLHLLRGIPRQAVRQNTLVQGTQIHAAQIADTNSTCAWNGDMYGVDMSRTGAQDYYDSVFRLFADWGVDFVKVDDIARPYHKPEIEAIRRAIDRSGRPMLLSLSPGETPLSEGAHVSTHANMWRISDDFWDRWPLLLPQFKRLRQWTPYRGPGHFPDADMLPLGVIGMGRRTKFTPEEQYTLMSLWCIARSPLIFGGDMTRMDSLTVALLTNSEVLAVDQHSTRNHELFHTNGLVAWVADVPDSSDKYVALFNTRDAAPDATTAQVTVEFAQLGLTGECRVRALWQQKDLGSFRGRFSAELPSHGAGLYCITGARIASDPAHRAVNLERPLPWPDGIIPYDLSRLTLEQQALARRAMQRWMDTGARIAFVPRRSEHEYVNFTGRTDAGNNTTQTGFKPGTRTDINITAFWWRQGEWMPAHELGHALGFHHEHQRWDRDAYVRIHYENIKAGRRSDYDWIPQAEWLVTNTAYDYYSIMHYRVCWASACESDCKDGIGSSPCAVISPLDTQYDNVIGQWDHNGISAGDGEKARLTYGVGRTVYVRLGNGQQGRGTLENPFRALATARGRCANSDRIILLSGGDSWSLAQFRPGPK